MRRAGVFLMAVLALVAMTAAEAAAQPKVTITGFVDNLVTYDRNMSVGDINVAHPGDKELYARTRVRPDITAEVGTTKFVLGIEIDATWGQTAPQDTNVCLGTSCQAAGTNQQRSGASAGWDLNTDTVGILEVKWAYTEFMIPGFPGATVFRIGAQPFQTQYKLATLANGDFPGINITSTWSPMVKTNFTYAFIEEQSTGPMDNFIRGEDFAIIASVEVTPIKGLDIRPIFSWAQFVGPTSSQSRQGKGGVGTGSPTPFSACPGQTGPGTGNCSASAAGGSSVENRYTIGIDARWRFGAFSLDPTFFYQFGNREIVLTTPNQFVQAGTHNQDLDAWFLDLRGGWQAGPLLLEGAFIYTSGNKKEDRLDLGVSKVKYYQPIDNDTSFYAAWAEIWALGIDYFNIINSGAGGLNPGVSIGYDKYGLMRVGMRASYALTPAFTLRAAANANWTAHETAGTLENISAGAGRTPCAGFSAADATITGACNAALSAHNGSNYLGTELDLGFQWRFVPNVALDVVGAYMFAGSALAANLATNAQNAAVTTNARNPQDIQTVTARIRYSW